MPSPAVPSSFPFAITLLLAIAACSRPAPAVVPETSTAPTSPPSATSVDSAPYPGPTGWAHAGTNPDRYTIGIDSGIAHGGRRSAVIRSKPSATAAMSSTMPQTVDAGPFVGKRIRVSAYLRRSAPGSCEGFIRVDGQHDGQPAMLRFTSSDQKPARCTTRWTEYSLVTDVPEGAEHVVYGFGLKGRGTAWIDDVGVMVVDSAYPLSPQKAGLPQPRTPDQKATADTAAARLKEIEREVVVPSNLGFEH